MESVVYANGWNQVRENVLSGAAWLGNSSTGGSEVIEQLRKPTALICSTKGAERLPIAGGRAKRDDQLLAMIRSTISKGGTVLIPTDTSARVLELAYMLEHAWQQDGDGTKGDSLKAAKLYLASRNVGATMRYARSMLEWMDESIVREFEAEATNPTNRQHRRTDSKKNRSRSEPDQDTQTTKKPSGPFDFKFIRMLERPSQVKKIMQKQSPKVILASDTSLEWGFSREILHRIASDPSNLVILTEDSGTQASSEEGSSSSLTRRLWQWYKERKDGVAMEKGPDGHNLEQVHTGGRELKFTDAERTPLEGKELAFYQQYLATQRQLQNTSQSANQINLESSADAVDENSSTSSSSSDESDPELQGKALNLSATLAHANRGKLGISKEAFGVNVLLQQPGVYDYDVRGKKGRETMFPYTTKRRRGDNFGDLIRPEEYLRAEERDEIDGQDPRDPGTGKHMGLGEKRKWEESGLQNANGMRGSNGGSKRRKAMKSSEQGTIHQTNGVAVSEDDLSDLASDEETEELAFSPSKLTYTTRTVQVSLRLAYVDFSGLHDQRSLSMLIPLIQPRKVVLIGGNVSETAWLANECRQKLSTAGMQTESADQSSANTIYTPLVGETVSASMDTNAWTVKLSEALVRRFHWQNVRGLGIVTVMGCLASATDEDGPHPLKSPTTELARKRQKLSKSEPSKEDIPISDVPTQQPNPPSTSSLPTLEPLPSSRVAATLSVSQPLHIGDLRLADLRRILQSSGHSAEFRGEGTLLIDELVAVKKTGTGKIEVESVSTGGGGGAGGAVGKFGDRGMGMGMGMGREESFLAVRRRIYEGLAVVAGG